MPRCRKLSRRAVVEALAALTLGITAERSALAQKFPTKPVRLISPYAPGGAADITSRLLAEGLSRTLGKPVIIDNVSGASGAVGGAIASKAPADGYTLYTGALGANVLQPMLDSQLSYDPAKTLKPIIKLVRVELVLAARQDSKSNNLKQLIELSRPGTALAFGSSGAGGANHLAGELLKQVTALDMVHVPYRGESPAVTDLIGGQIELAVISTSIASPQVRASKIKIIANLGAQRSLAFPDVATVAEQGFTGYEAETWFGLFAPVETPQPIVDLLYDAAQKVLEDPQTQEMLTARGMVPVLAANDGKTFHASMDRERKRWRQVLSKIHMLKE